MAFVVLANGVGLVHLARAERANELRAYSMLGLTKSIGRPKFSRVPAGDGWSYSRIGALIDVSANKISHLIKIAGYRGIPDRIPADTTTDPAPEASGAGTQGESTDAAGHAMMAAIRRRIREG